MKKIIVLLLFICFSHFAQSQHLQVAGKLESDTLSASYYKIYDNNSPKLIGGNGQLMGIGNNLSLTNGFLSANSVSVGNKTLFKSTAGSQFRLIQGSQADSLAIPFASDTAEGLMSNQNQTIPGTKVLNNDLYISPTAFVRFQNPNTVNWNIQRGPTGNLLFNYSGGTNRMSVNLAGGMSIIGTLFVDGLLESPIGFKDSRNNTSILMANGSVAKYSLSESKVHVNGAATTIKGIGIKTSMPEALFHINGSGYLSNQVFRVSSDGSAAIAVNSTDGGWTGITFGRQDDEKWFVGMTGKSFKTSTNLFFNGSNNVGLGTETPSEKLQVSGNVKATNLKIAGASANQLIHTNGGTLNIGNNLSLANNTLTATIPLFNIVEHTTATTLNMTISHDYVFVNNASAGIQFPDPAGLKGKRWQIRNLHNTSAVNIAFQTANSFIKNDGTSNNPSTFTLAANKTAVFFCSGTKYYLEGEL